MSDTSETHERKEELTAAAVREKKGDQAHLSYGHTSLPLLHVLFSLQVPHTVTCSRGLLLWDLNDQALASHD